MARSPGPVTERARTLPAVISKAMGGPRHGLQGASILRGSGHTRCHGTPGSERQGHDGLFDGRTRRPGPRPGPLSMVASGVWLDREPSFDVHMGHCHERLREAQGIQRRDTWVQTRLRRGGLVPRRRRWHPPRLRRHLGHCRAVMAGQRQDPWLAARQRHVAATDQPRIGDGMIGARDTAGW